MEKINNEIYDEYGDRWYTAYDDPVALLRAESLVKSSWVIDKIKHHGFFNPTTKILDVGCGAGFLSNSLALQGFQVTGIDMSDESLKVARKFDETKSVEYLFSDAYKMPFPDEHFEVLTAMDFLEHIDRPADMIKEFSRVLKPNGVFIFHTFNRNPLAYVVIIKLVEWLVKNTPKNMHVLHLFIKPNELKEYCLKANMTALEFVGVKPVYSTIPIKNLFSGIVPKSIRFELTQSLLLAYMGIAVKESSE